MVRIKSRYLLLSSTTPTQPSSASHLHHLITASYTSLFGTLAFPGHINVKEWNKQDGRGIVRCARKEARRVWAAITAISRIKGMEIVINVKHVGGTIRACQAATAKIVRQQIIDNSAIDEYPLSDEESSQDDVEMLSE